MWRTCLPHSAPMRSSVIDIKSFVHVINVVSGESMAVPSSSKAHDQQDSVA